MEIINRMVATVGRPEALNSEETERTEEFMRKNTQVQNLAMWIQFEEMSRDLLMRFEGKMEWMGTEMRESKKRALQEITNQGLGKAQNTSQK